MPARRPTKLGIALTFGLLVGLMFWRIAVPNATPWLDTVALTVVGILLLAIRAYLQRNR